MAFDGLAVHHTGGNSLEGALETLRQRRLRGYNVFVDRDGRIIPNPMVPPGAPGQHMRPSWGQYQGRSNANTEGIAAIARDDSDVTPAQARAIAEYARRYAPDRVWGHGQLNPGHKHPQEGMAGINAYRALGVAPPPQPPRPPQPPTTENILAGSRYDDGTPGGTLTVKEAPMMEEPRDPIRRVAEKLGLDRREESNLRLGLLLGGDDPFAGLGGFESGGFGSSGVG